MNSLCCIGHLTNDRIIMPQQTVDMTGGVAYYFSYALARLPQLVDYTLVTKLSRRDFCVVESLREAGVKVHAHESKATVFFENIYGENLDERRQRVLEMADPFTESDIADLHADVFHLGTLLPSDFNIDLVRALKRRGRVSIDAQGFLRCVEGTEVKARQWEDKEQFLRYVDIIKVNEEELFALTGTSDIRCGSAAIAALGPQEVIVTLGSLGSQILHNGELIAIPAYPQNNVVDSTGCGDTYMAGYLFCRTLGRSPRHAGCFAAAMCTLKLSRSGPFCGTIEDVSRVMGEG